MPSKDSVVEAVPGIWDTNGQTGLVLVTNLSEVDAIVQKGAIVAGIVAVVAQTRACETCSVMDTDAWLVEGPQAVRCPH